MMTSIASTALALLIGVPASYALSRGGFKSSRRIALWILATRMAPPIAFTIPFFLAYRFLGLTDTLLGLILVYLTFNLALVIWMMQPFFDSVPRELEEAAWIDGCGVWERLLARHPAAVGAGARGDGRDLLHPVVERLLLCAGPDAHPGLDRAGRDRQLHPVHGLGVGPHRGRRHAGDAAGRRLLHPRPQLPGPRPRGRRRQGIVGRGDRHLGGTHERAHGEGEAAYDFIVVGGGSAGSAVAARLSESGRHRVLLLEAGEDDPWIWLRVPLGAGYVLLSERGLWRFYTEPEANLANRRMFWPRGRVLGGSSTVNGMLWVRGEPAEYDHWRDLGNPGWGYDDVLPFLKRMEAYAKGDRRGARQGRPDQHQPLRPRHAGRRLPPACVEAGIPATPDYNGDQYEGVGYLQSNTKNGLRFGGREAYLRPARGRENLHVRTGARAHRIRVEKGRAVGVEYRVGERTHFARARAR